MTDCEVFYPETAADWRSWLEQHHLSRKGVWVVFYRKSSGRASLTWSDAVDVALCFGWIDSKKIRIDDQTSHQFFSRRKAGSTWSAINKDKVTRLTGEGLMAPAGLNSIRQAQEDGSWTLLDTVEALVIPPDLQKALEAFEGAEAYFQSLSKTMRKMLLQWLVLARRPETRQKRVAEIARNASQKQKPKGF